jgi:hypothetical protein
VSWSGEELPDAAGLLEVALATLRTEVVPALEGDGRFKALMVANAIAIALREIELRTDELRALRDEAAAFGGGDLARLCAEIRAGRFDPGSEDHDALAAVLAAFADARCRISAPKSLQE